MRAFVKVFVRRPPAFVARFEAAGIRKPSQKPTLHDTQADNGPKLLPVRRKSFSQTNR
jgi:hypothetical protein